MSGREHRRTTGGGGQGLSPFIHASKDRVFECDDVMTCEPLRDRYMSVLSADTGLVAVRLSATLRRSGAMGYYGVRTDHLL
eukprot:313634-Pyramimonas_sp.AAC.1